MVNTTTVKSVLVIKYLVGQDEQGKDVFKVQRLQNLKTDAKDEDVFNIATALGNLLENHDVEVTRQNAQLIVAA